MKLKGQQIPKAVQEMLLETAAVEPWELLSQGTPSKGSTLGVLGAIRPVR